MPTAGRLAGAVALAVLGGYIAYLLVPLFKEGQMPGYWFPLCVGAGIWAGWVVLGKRTGRGYLAGIGNGITGTLAMAFWIVFIVAFVDMIRKSMRRSYDGPVEAVVNVFEIMLEYLMQFANTDVATALVVGAVLVGLFAEFFGKRFP